MPGGSGIFTNVVASTIEAQSQVRCAGMIDDSATAGARTVNAIAGKSAIASGTSSVVITNSFVTSSSIVLAMLLQNDATLTFIKSVVPGTGSFTVTGNGNAGADAKFAWYVINP